MLNCLFGLLPFEDEDKAWCVGNVRDTTGVHIKIRKWGCLCFDGKAKEACWGESNDKQYNWKEH